MLPNILLFSVLLFNMLTVILGDRSLFGACDDHIEQQYDWKDALNTDVLLLD